MGVDRLLCRAPSTAAAVLVDSVGVLEAAAADMDATATAVTALRCVEVEADLAAVGGLCQEVADEARTPRTLIFAAAAAATGTSFALALVLAFTPRVLVLAFVPGALVLALVPPVRLPGLLAFVLRLGHEVGHDIAGSTLTITGAAVL